MAENAPAPRVQPAPRLRPGETAGRAPRPTSDVDIEEAKRMQRELQAAGYDLGPRGVDGVVGADTRAAYNKLMADRRDAEQRAQVARQESERIAAEKAKADAAAQAARAAADAELQRAQTERVKAEAAAAKARADAEAAEAVRKAKAEQDERDRIAAAEKAAQDNQKALNKALLNIGLPVAGIVAGHLAAHQVEKKWKASVDARNEQLKALAGDISKQIAKADKLKGAAKTASNKKLTGMVRTADSLRLTKMGAPLGLATAATLVIDGAIARLIVAPNIKDEVTAEAVRAGGTALALVGTGLVGSMVLTRNSPSAVADARSMAAVEQARALVDKPQKTPRAPKAPAVPAPAITQSPLVKAGLQAAKWLAPVVAAGAAAVAMSRAATAGESAGEVVKQGAAAGADVLTAGAVTNYEEAKAEGDSSILAGAKAIAKAAIDFATFGVGTLALGAGDRTREQLRQMMDQRDAKSAGPMPSARSAEDAGMGAYLNEEARQKAEAMPPVAAGAPRMNVAMPTPDNTTEGYTTTRRTKSGLIQVQVGSYRTPGR